MTRRFLYAKIHRATVTQVELHYTGSITIDANLLDASGIAENELVQVLNINNGQRFETYVIRGEPGRGSICLNGAAARLAMVGDKVIIASYCELPPNEIADHKPKVVHVDAQNRRID